MKKRKRRKRRRLGKSLQRYVNYASCLLGWTQICPTSQKAAVRAERVQKLVDNLERKLSIFTESATGPNDRDVSQSWTTICELETEWVSNLVFSLYLLIDSDRELKRESYGVELLQCIGFVYVSKAKHHLATNQTFLGVGGWLHNVQGKYHVFSET